MTEPLVAGRINCLTRDVLRVTDDLGLYRAETARILGLQCGHIGALGSGRFAIDPRSEAGRRARQFVALHALLDRVMQGDSVAAFHWFRKTNTALGATPLLRLVDEGDFAGVRAELERHGAAKTLTS